MIEIFEVIVILIVVFPGQGGQKSNCRFGYLKGYKIEYRISCTTTIMYTMKTYILIFKIIQWIRP